MKKPKYVKIVHNGVIGSAMRLEKTGRYYRDAGCWDIASRWTKGVLTANPDYSQVMHLKGATFIEVSFEEWKKDNGLDNMKEFEEFYHKLAGGSSDAIIASAKAHLRSVK